LAGRCRRTAWGLPPAGCKLSTVTMSFSLFLHGHGLNVAPDAVNQSSHALNAGFR
jgi:hypothetical protein